MDPRHSLIEASTHSDRLKTSELLISLCKSLKTPGCIRPPVHGLGCLSGLVHDRDAYNFSATQLQRQQLLLSFRKALRVPVPSAFLLANLMQAADSGLLCLLLILRPYT